MKFLLIIMISLILLCIGIFAYNIIFTEIETEYSNSGNNIKDKYETFKKESDYSVSYFLNKTDLNFNKSEKRYLEEKNMNISFSKGIDRKNTYLVLIIDQLNNSDCLSYSRYVYKNNGIADELIINNALFKKPNGNEILNINNIATANNIENICKISRNEAEKTNMVTLIKYL